MQQLHVYIPCGVLNIVVYVRCSLTQAAMSMLSMEDTQCMNIESEEESMEGDIDVEEFSRTQHYKAGMVCFSICES